ncbi:T9SS type A sorting domain-containing protein, partial [candidate division KSB1 bacterium]|nr:T9SS type A sorting domain-containing protein [candidate division KSB1 bacterium]
MEEYDPGSDTWAAKASMPFAKRHLEVQVSEGKLFAMGGYFGIATNFVEVYDFLTDEWAQTDAMTTARESFASAVVSDSIYVFGGQNSSIISSGEVFVAAQPLSPSGIVATGGDGFVDLIWDQNADTDIFQYAIFRSLSSGFTPGPSDSIGRTLSPDTTFTDSSVLNNTFYFYKLSVIDTNFNVSVFSSEVSAFPRDTITPATPQNFIAQPDDKNINLSWSANSEADLKQYIVYRNLSTGFSPTSGDSLTRILKPDSTFIDSNLTNGATYFYILSAVDSSLNESGFTSEVSATPVDTSAPAAPQNLIATGKNESVQLTWNLSTEPDLLRYNLYRSLTNGFSPSSSDSLSVISPADTVFLDSTVTVGIVYHYKVSALDSSGNESAFSNQATAVPIDTVAPAAPQNITVTAGERLLDVSWSANTEADVDHYIVYRSLVNGFTPNSSDSLTLVSAPDTTYRDLAIIVDSTFYYRISAVDTASNESSFSLQASNAPFDSTAPAVPQNLIAVGGGGIITLDWDTNTEADLLQYTVYRSTSQGFSPTPGDSLTRIFPPTTTHIDSTVTPDITYYYVLSALDSFNQESNFSNEASATAFDPTPPADPVNLIASAGNGQIDLVWDRITDPDLLMYVIYRSITNGFSPASSDSITIVIQPDTTYTDNDVVNGQTYYYRIAAVDSLFNYSGFSNEATATPVALQSYPWQTKTPITTGRREPVAGVLGGRIYIVGGRIGNQNNQFTLELEEYDPAGDSLTIKTSMLTDREDFAGAVITDRFFIIGGRDGNTRLDRLEAYKATTDTWETLTSMTSIRRDLAAVVVADKLYAIGGRRNNNAVRDDIEEYDPLTNTWTTRTVMPTLRWGLAAAAVNDKIYAIGGDNGTVLSTVEEYDPSTDTWTTKTSMPTPRRNLSANTIAGRIYAIGGEDDAGYFNIVEIYDPATDIWTTGDSMFTARSEFATAVVNDIKLYAIGGYDGTTNFAVNEEYNPPPWQPLNLAADVQASQVDLNWDANIEPDLSYYTIYRSTSDGFTATVNDVVGRVSKENTTFADDTVLPTTTYFYRLSAVDSVGQESDSLSTQVSVTTPNLALSLGTIDSILTNGDTLTIPLTFFGNFSNSGVTSFQYTISYDSLQLNFLFVDTTGFGNSVTLFSNASLGELKIAAVVEDTLKGTNKVMNLVFEVDDDARRDTSTIQVTEAFLNEGTPAIDKTSTTFIVHPRYGDVSGNNSITSFDASLVLQNVVGLETFSTGRSEKADVTFNGSVTALDAFFILLRAANLISSFPVEDSLTSKVSVNFDETKNRITRSVLVDNEKGELTLQIDAESAKSISSIYLDLDFDKTRLSFEGVYVSERYIRYIRVENIDDGNLKLAMTGVPAVDIAGNIMKVRFSLKNRTGDINSDLLTINKLEINDIDFSSGVLDNDRANIPAFYELKQNYPNPFNPETTIMYQIPNSSYVIIKIFNILGQEVRTLVNKELTAGYYSERWDGRNEYGITVSPGVYLYRIKAGSFVRTMKMVIVK